MSKIQLSHMTETDFPKKIAENVTMYSADPIVYVVNDFLNDQECNSFIEAGKNKLKESTVISSDQHVNIKVEPAKIVG